MHGVGVGWLACSDIRARPGIAHCHNIDKGGGRDKPREGCIVGYVHSIHHIMVHMAQLSVFPSAETQKR